MKKKKSRKHSKLTDNDIVTQNEDFYFIAGYTPNGVPFGTTWEEASETGLIENVEEATKEEVGS